MAAIEHHGLPLKATWASAHSPVADERILGHFVHLAVNLQQKKSASEKWCDRVMVKRVAQKILKTALAAAGIALLTICGFAMAARSGWLKPSEPAMRERYALPNSRFADIGGQNIHFVDEGKGETILLLHGSFGSLRMWNDWAQALSPDYRVIRFDRPSMGLSDPRVDGKYDAETEQQIILDLANSLGVQRFVLAATSSGGEAAAAFAATHPERIRGLILSNVAAGPLPMAPPHFSPWMKAVLWADGKLGGWHPQALWRGVLEMNFADPSKVSPELVQEWTDLNNRAQGIPRQPRAAGYIPFARTPGDLKRSQAPTLLLWSDKDPEVPLETEGAKTLKLLGSNRKILKVVRNCGHMLPIECGKASVQHVQAFLATLAEME